MKYMDLNEFIDIGYLHEVNRQFLHPHGLALVVSSGEDGWSLSGIRDDRDDPEGIIFSEHVLNSDAAQRVQDIENERRPAREQALGYWIQLTPRQQAEFNDTVGHKAMPKRYAATGDKPETIDMMRQDMRDIAASIMKGDEITLTSDELGDLMFAGCCQSMVTKYQDRAGKKGPADVDIAKSVWYGKMALTVFDQDLTLDPRWEREDGNVPTIAWDLPRVAPWKTTADIRDDIERQENPISMVPESVPLLELNSTTRLQMITVIANDVMKRLIQGELTEEEAFNELIQRTKQ